jgi:hypothetical protein
MKQILPFVSALALAVVLSQASVGPVILSGELRQWHTITLTLAGPAARAIRRGKTGGFRVRWFNPRAGGALADGSVKAVQGGGKVMLGLPPAEPGLDWLTVVRK